VCKELALVSQGVQNREVARRKLLHLTDQERRTLAAPGIVALSLFGLVLLGVITGLTHPIDLYFETLYHSYNNLLLIIESPGQRRVVYPLAIVLGTVISWRRKDLLPVVVTVSALVFTNAVTGVVKLVVARGYPRTSGPEAFNYAAFKGDGSLSSYAHYVWQLGAFPSGHAANVAAASTLMVLAAYSAREAHRKWAVPITILTIIVCTITIICSWLRNTHWVTDLLAGIALGIATTIATTLWALHLPQEWRHPDLAGKSRLITFGSVVAVLALVFAFASSSVLSHSVTSIVLVIGTLVVVARQSHKSIQRTNDSNQAVNQKQ